MHFEAHIAGHERQTNFMCLIILINATKLQFLEVQLCIHSKLFVYKENTTNCCNKERFLQMILGNLFSIIRMLDKIMTVEGHLFLHRNTMRNKVMY